MLNPYLANNTVGYANTHALYEGMIIESIQVSGQNYIYVPRTLSTSYDRLFGEDGLSRFESSVEIEMYLENVNSYGGESEMLSKIGMEIRDTATFIVSRKRYTDVVIPILPPERNPQLKWRPNEGDLIYAPYSQSLFEIKFVEDEYPGFYQLSKKFVWALRCELVQLNNEKFNTGVPEIDGVFGMNENRLNYSILAEDGSYLLTEDGGRLLSEDYFTQKDVDDIRGYGDDEILKKEFLEIMDFSIDNPFSEKF